MTARENAGSSSSTGIPECRAQDLDSIRAAMRADTIPDENAVLAHLLAASGLDTAARAEVGEEAAALVRAVRGAGSPGLMQSFLTEYGLSSREGVALMCLAEALLRVPDEETIDALIEDKIAPSDWGRHLGHSSSPLVNASTWALMLTGRVLDDDDTGLAGVLRGAVKRLGEPVIRTAVAQAMREMGRQFVLGRDIGEAMKRGREMEERGYSYSYDMLGEAARTHRDAERYLLHYADAISRIAPACTPAAEGGSVRNNPGISVKLSALSPRYEMVQHARVMAEVVPRVMALAQVARAANMGFNIDAEEQDRLDLSLDVIEAVVSHPAMAGWDGFGVVVQAYGPRAGHVIDWLQALAESHDRRLMVRLVKGAYWDAEIKRAQVLGLDGFPVFTRKVNTDVSYIANGAKLLAASRLYPQFATHNAHTVAAIRHLARAAGTTDYEFQKLHGMGDELYDEATKVAGTHCRIYAPVGAHRDLLAYLVRRLLENGANSSFVHQIVDEAIPPEEIAKDPLAEAEALVAAGAAANPRIPAGPAIYGPGRVNANGWDLTEPLTLATLDAAREPWRAHIWQAGPLLGEGTSPEGGRAVTNPTRPDEVVGHVVEATAEDVSRAIDAGLHAAPAWGAMPAADRSAILRRAADLYEENATELFALCAREAGKTQLDAVAELREAVDFLRYYANEAERLAVEEPGLSPRGLVACISPWNFPLAIFTGQIAAALAAGNAVIAKPAEQTPLIACRAVALMREAGVPAGVLQLLPGDGPTVGAPLTADPRLGGIAFTGSTETAKLIERAQAANATSDAMLLAETGGLNAMIVDSTALPEQAVRDIVISAFQSAGQRCSACRMLYLQEDVADRVLEMLGGAMQALVLGDPWALSTDVGPVIDATARDDIDAYVEKARSEGRLIRRLEVPAEGNFVAPAILRVDGIGDLEREVFGPVLHVATYRAEDLDRVIDAINAIGYGLTFGLHTRIDDRVTQVIGRIRAGNAYVNRNQIGAIVGSQPFGGEGLSGTGPKAGGPAYVARFMKPEPPHRAPAGGGWEVREAGAEELEAAVTALRMPPFSPAAVSLPGPTGESNRLSEVPRGIVLCLGPGPDLAMAQASKALSKGNAVLVVTEGSGRMALRRGPHAAFIQARLAPEALETLTGIAAVAHDGPEPERAMLRRVLAERTGPILPLLSAADLESRYALERHVCIDTTAAGGNATLMAEADDAGSAAA
ncbi:MAG: bifunctional proline dehydrogenase/L-glutamate gamma-semialdehyde dehydrogenase PutA [Pseudomonadota bacterium]